MSQFNQWYHRCLRRGIAVIFWAPLGRVFHAVPIGPAEVVALGVLGSLGLWAEEIRKLFVRRRTR